MSRTKGIKKEVARKGRYGAYDSNPYPSPDPNKFTILTINREPYYRFLGTGRRRKDGGKKVSILVLK